MKKTAFSLILLAGTCFVVGDALADQGPVVSRTETTYTKQNEIVMNGYTPLDVIDNSVINSEIFLTLKYHSIQLNWKKKSSF